MKLIESKTTKRLFKSKDGVEIKPSLLYINQETGNSSDQTYYYAWYYQDKFDFKWKIKTNAYLYGESEVIVICESMEEAVKTAHVVNSFIHLLISNIQDVNI